MASCENTIACERARPLDQANSKTCVLHAIANAVAEACMDHNLDLKLDELVGGLKQLHFVDIVGNRVEDLNGAGLKKMTDFNTRNLYDIQIRIRTQTPEEVLTSLQVQEMGIKFVMVYQDNAIRAPHCVYVKEFAVALGKPHFVCINSWGPNNDILLKEVGQVSTLYEVAVTYELSKSRMSSSNETFTYHVQLPPPCVYPTTPNRLHFDSVQSSPAWTPSFNSSYSSSPTFTESNSWINMGRDSMDLETGQAPAEVPDPMRWPEDFTSRRASDCPSISGIFI